jgi:ATP phosphoribosyltransferase regulatory subunit
MDLRELAAMAGGDEPQARILAPHAPQDKALQAEIARLREAGSVVIVDLPGHEGSRGELACDRQLVKRGNAWKVE